MALVAQEVLALVAQAILALEAQEILVLAVLDFQVAQEFQMLQVALAVLDFLAVQLYLEAQSPYRLQLVRSCHPVLFYHRALSNNQVHIFLLE